MRNNNRIWLFLSFPQYLNFVERSDFFSMFVHNESTSEIRVGRDSRIITKPNRILSFDNSTKTTPTCILSFQYSTLTCNQIDDNSTITTLKLNPIFWILNEGYSVWNPTLGVHLWPTQLYQSLLEIVFISFFWQLVDKIWKCFYCFLDNLVSLQNHDFITIFKWDEQHTTTQALNMFV
jgi:hypothetical protein